MTETNWFESDEFWDGLLLDEDDPPEDDGEVFEMTDWECPNCGYFNQNFPDDLDFTCFHCGYVINAGDL